jgi:hypothetical protein
MKKFIIVVTAVLFALSLSTAVLAEDKCDKCHKGEKAVDKIVAKKAVKSADDLVKAVRGSSKAKMHEKLTDADIKAAFKADDKKAAPAPADKPKKKKAAEGC